MLFRSAAVASGQSLGDMFGNASAINAAEALFQGGPEAFQETLAEMNNASGSVDSNFEKMLGPAERFDKATNRLKNNLIELGGQASPYIERLADKVSDLSEKLSELDGDTVSTIAQWGLLLVAAGPLISIFGVIFGVIGKVAIIGGLLLKGFEIGRAHV